MHKWIFIGFDMLLVVDQHIQKFDCIDWQVHVDVVGVLEVFG